jgi:hypothetical protein
MGLVDNSDEKKTEVENLALLSLEGRTSMRQKKHLS